MDVILYLKNFNDFYMHSGITTTKDGTNEMFRKEEDSNGKGDFFHF